MDKVHIDVLSGEDIDSIIAVEFLELKMKSVLMGIIEREGLIGCPTVKSSYPLFKRLLHSNFIFLPLGYLRFDSLQQMMHPQRKVIYCSVKKERQHTPEA